VLLGRDRELDALERLLAEARAGRSAVLALVGETGIGKTALLAEAARRATGMRILRARGVQSEAQVPFAGLFELLRPVLGVLERIPAPQADALAGALALRPARSHDRFAVGAATLSLLAASAEAEPFVVLVDDVQWLDGSSADALLFAVRRLLADPVAVVLAAREGEPSLLAGAGLPQLPVGGLDAGATAALLGRDAADPLAVRLHRDTGGNPLAVLELAEREVAGEVPPGLPLPVATTVGEAFARRAAELPERTRTMLLLAAAHDGGDVAALARAGARLGVDVADLDPAEAAGLAAVRGGHVELRHPLVRSALYAQAPPARRREIHRALADALPDAERDRRAWHLALAAVGFDETASAALEAAGARARERSAYVVAASALERAARLAPDDARAGRLLYAAADAAWLGGLAARAEALLDDAAARAPDRALAARIAHLRGHIVTRRGPVAEGHAILAAAAEEAAAVEPEQAVAVLADAAHAAFLAADPAALGAVAARAQELRTDRTAFLAAVVRGMALIFAGAGEEGAAALREALAELPGLAGPAAAAADGPSAGDEPTSGGGPPSALEAIGADPRLLTWAAMVPLWLREAEAGRELVDRLLAAARDRAALGALPLLLNHVAIDHAGAGRWPAAEAGFDEAMRLARESGQRSELALALSRLAWLAARQGREDACREHAREALAVSREVGAALFEIWTWAALADLELALGRPAEALEALERRSALLAERGVADPDLSPGPELVEVLLRLGRAAEAESTAEACEQAAAAKGQPWALARAARARALLAGDDGFEAAFEAALALHAQTPDAFEAARTRLAYGARLRRARRRVQARAPLRAAIAAFDRLGAAPWSEHARAELAATGETARRRDPSTIDALTPQELQIGLLLAEGRTTREAAAALFLSPKTIEYHLRNAYRKLGVRSRDALAAALGVEADSSSSHPISLAAPVTKLLQTPD
jgi:DNA-binding CsgD family transcriptional regulator